MRRFPLLTTLIAGLLTGVIATATQAKTQWDPRAYKSAIAGRATQVLVLGSPHLSQLKGFAPASLAPLLDRLAAFKPEVITIEGLSGPDCAALDAYRSVYATTFDDYCWKTDEARAATGLDLPAAIAAVDKTLAAWPAAPTAAERRRLASLFLAAGDRASAQVQWLRLPLAERRAGDGLDDALVTVLRRASGKFNENYDLAAALAARLGLERVYPVDDHSSDAIVANNPAAYGEALQRVWGQSGETPFRADYERQLKSVGTPADVLTLYRFLNAPATQQAAVAMDMGANARDATPALWGRQYLAWWETRNLRMVANIRAAAGTRPGARVLAVVGSTHKPYFDAYLDMMQDVAVVDVAGVLR